MIRGLCNRRGAQCGSATACRFFSQACDENQGISKRCNNEHRQLVCEPLLQSPSKTADSEHELNNVCSRKYRAGVTRNSAMRLRDNFPSSFLLSYGFNHAMLNIALSILLGIPPLRFGRGFKSKLTMPDMSSCVSDVGSYSEIRGCKNQCRNCQWHRRPR
jgi:hypothetical protein